MFKFSGTSPNTDSSDSLRSFWAVLVGICILFSLWGTLHTLTGQRAFSEMENSGKFTTGVIIAKIRRPSSNDSERVYHFIRYGFENPAASIMCELSKPKLTTPKDQICATTIRLHKLANVHFDKVKVGDEVDVIYLNKNSKTQSIIISYDNIRLELKIKFFFFILLGLIPSALLYRNW